MTSRKISYIFIPVILLLAVAGIFKNSISADSNLNEPVSEKSFSVNVDGKKTIFKLQQYKDQEQNYFVISRKNAIGRNAALKLTGFEALPNLCNTSVIKLAKNAGNAICLVGDVGVHSQNIELVKYYDGKLSGIGVTDENKAESIFSDVPHYDFTDKNNDGFLDLVVDLRDYDKDPIMDAIRTYYLNSGSEFVFDGKENITYNN